MEIEPPTVSLAGSIWTCHLQDYTRAKMLLTIRNHFYHCATAFISQTLWTTECFQSGCHKEMNLRLHKTKHLQVLRCFTLRVFFWFCLACYRKWSLKNSSQGKIWWFSGNVKQLEISPNGFLCRRRIAVTAKGKRMVLWKMMILLFAPHSSCTEIIFMRYDTFVGARCSAETTLEKNFRAATLLLSRQLMHFKNACLLSFIMFQGILAILSYSPSFSLYFDISSW